MPIAQNELIEAGIARGLIAREVVDGLRAEAHQRRQRMIDFAASRRRFPVSSLYRAATEEHRLPFVNLCMVPSTPP